LADRFLTGSMSARPVSWPSSSVSRADNQVAREAATKAGLPVAAFIALLTDLDG
jgi:hypothetical protein